MIEGARGPATILSLVGKAQRWPYIRCYGTEETTRVGDLCPSQEGRFSRHGRSAGSRHNTRTKDHRPGEAKTPLGATQGLGALLMTVLGLDFCSLFVLLAN